jgi:hypothetical protein
MKGLGLQRGVGGVRVCRCGIRFFEFRVNLTSCLYVFLTE